MSCIYHGCAVISICLMITSAWHALGPLQDDAKHKKVVKYWSGVSLVLLVFTAILVLAFAGITFVVVDQTKAVRSTEGRMFAGLGGTGQVRACCDNCLSRLPIGYTCI